MKNHEPEPVQDFVYTLLRTLGRRAWKWAVGFFGWWLLLFIPAMMALAWFTGGGRGQAASDPIAQAAFPDGWLDRAVEAAENSVDSTKPDQASFQLDPEAIGALRLLDHKSTIDKYDPSRIAQALGPLFEYQTYPISTTTTWEECTVVPPETPPGEAPSADGNAETTEVPPQPTTVCEPHTNTDEGEVSLLTRVRQFDGVTEFAYKQESRTRPEGGKTITETGWKLDKQTFEQDLSRLLECLQTFGFSPPERYVNDFFFYLNNAHTDPLEGDPWSSGGGWQMPGSAYYGPVDPGLPKDGWYWPTPDSRRITDPFGWRTHPIRGTRNFHTGVDIGASWGSPVISVRAGVVTYAGYGWNAGYGNRVIVSLDNGSMVTYNHLERIEVEEGQAVSAGQRVGLVGTTGNSTGPHLHFEILVSGQAIDPWPYLP